MKEALEQKERSLHSRRRFIRAAELQSYMDVQRRPYIHLIDGGIADNLGLRGAIDHLTATGSLWRSFQHLGWENTRQVVFIVVNAEKRARTYPDDVEKTLSTAQVLKSIATTPMARYNFETIELLKANFKEWGEEIRSHRCHAEKDGDKAERRSSEANPCADIKFYLIEVDFDSLKNSSERSYLRTLPTSFHLPPEAVDRLRAAGRHLLKESPELKRLLLDVNKD